MMYDKGLQVKINESAFLPRYTLLTSLVYNHRAISPKKTNPGQAAA